MLTEKEKLAWMNISNSYNGKIFIESLERLIREYGNIENIEEGKAEIRRDAIKFIRCILRTFKVLKKSKEKKKSEYI